MIFQCIKTFDMQIEACKLKTLFANIWCSEQIVVFTFAINSTSCRLSCHVISLKIISAIFLNFCRNIVFFISYF
jgi:hypothetical protein